MNLKTYLFKNQMSASEFARRINVDTATVLRIKNSQVWPHRSTLIEIVKATGGLVRPCDLLGLADVVGCTDTPVEHNDSVHPPK